MSLEDNNLVDAIMNEMERNNGSYNEENGRFTGAKQFAQRDDRAPPSYQPQHKLSALQEEFLQLIRENQELTEMISNDPVNSAKINQILNHEEYLPSLMENRSIVPMVIRDLLQEQDQPEPNIKSTPDADHQEITPTPVNEQIPTTSIVMPPYLTEEKESNLTDFIIGPVLAAIAFFLVTNTPLLYYIGRIPYLGAYLVGNKLMTSLVLVMAIFIIGSLLIDIVGLI